MRPAPLNATTPAGTVPHIFALHPDGDKRPFFLCAPAAGVLFPCYNALQYWDAGRPFYAIQDPGLDPAVPVFHAVEDIARANVAAMKKWQPKGPYIVGGWSFGALVAFDMVNKLEQEGERAELIVLDMRVNGPGRESAFANLTALERCIAIPKVILAVFGQTGPYVRDGMYAMISDRVRRGSPFAPVLRPVLRLIGRAPIAEVIEQRPYLENVSTPGLFRCLYVLVANMRALGRYTPHPLRAHGALIKASDSASLGLHDPDPEMGWGRVLLGGVDVYETPGNHVTVMQQPAIVVVGSSMREALDTADRKLDTP